MATPPVPRLRLRGAQEHNLRSVDLDLDLGQWIAVTGPSGSGKTSLVFDVIVREGRRRFLGGMSARARHFFSKLGRADVKRLTGLPAPIALGLHDTPNPRSTVGTLTGGLDLLRLLFAREAADPLGEPLTRSHFSFNVAPGSCETCAGLGVEDRVDPALLVADPSRSIRAGALVPTLKNGYTVYSQVTLEVMDTICRAHGFDVETPWSALSDAQREVIFFGTKALKVPFGKHSIESRMKWEGITARPREEGFYRGLVPVIEETLTRNRNPNILRFVRSTPCPECGGTRLSRPGREAALGSHTLPALLRTPAAQLQAALDSLPASPTFAAVRPSLDDRLRRLLALGLGHLEFSRSSPSLSGGEHQRVRLAAQITSGLGGMLLALDEPTLGLHPDDQAGMRDVLDECSALGNTLLLVEHDPEMIRYADHIVDLGPGAGVEGGTILSSGRGGPDPLGPPPTPRTNSRSRDAVIELRGATLHNLRSASLSIFRGCFNVVLGPSGAGKSSLVFGTLLPALQGERGGPFTELVGAVPGAVAAMDARPIGRTPRSTPATWSGLFELVRKRFAELPEARTAKLRPGFFSYNNKEGRCPSCEGLGVERIGLHLLADVERSCSECGGGRYAPHALEVRWNGRSVAEVLAMSVTQACAFFADDPPLLALCHAMETLGLGYLSLGQSSAQLSRGEAQRIKLATVLGSTNTTGKSQLLLLDEPDRGLHPKDIERLLGAIDALVDAGHTVVAISHHRHVWAAADARTEVRDGRTHLDPKLDWSRLSTRRPPRPAAAVPQTLQLRGVTTHHLANLDLDLPHRQLIGIAGVSGSGKSSLAFDTLVAEAWHRYAESLPFAVRRFVRRQPRPPIDEGRGLTPTLALRQTNARAGRRSTVATQSGIGPLLRLLWSRANTMQPQLSAEHFSPDRPLGACPTCEGLGAQLRCSPQRLVTAPELPLTDGALAGTQPGVFFSAPDDQHMATLAAALAHRGQTADLHATPWSELPAKARDIALHGTGDQIYAVTWTFRRGKRAGEHSFEGPWLGLCALVEREAKRRAGRKNAEAWAAPLVDAPCPDCDGAGLRPEVATRTVAQQTLPETLALPLSELLEWLRNVPPEASERAAFDALRPELVERVADAVALGLGHLCASRRSQTLSDGELQRLRLASILRSSLTGTTVVLDEPSAGLHDRDVEALLGRLQALRDDGNTVVVVSHRAEVLRAMDHLVELGPGSGTEGGQLIAQGSTADVLSGDTLTAQALRATHLPRPDRVIEAGPEVRGACVHNLADVDFRLPTSGLVVVSGVSGSGKSTLLFDVLAHAGRGHDGTGRYATATGFSGFVEVRTSRDAAAGRTVLTAVDALKPLQKLYATASGKSLAAAAFSFDSPKGRCPACRGSGVERVAMDFMADLELPCPVCEGTRYRPEVLDVRWLGRTIAETLGMPVGSLPAGLPAGLAKSVQALEDVGLGHLALGRSTQTLSGGERSRLVLASALRDAPTPALYLLDEPGRGLHERDIASLLKVFDRLAARGDLIVVSAHRRSIIDAADWCVELGPGGGPRGGQLLRCEPAARHEDRGEDR